MHPKKDLLSIVIIGAWNPSIFSSEWVSKYLCENNECQVSIAFPISDPTAPRKLSFEDVHLFPGRKQLTIAPESPTLSGMEKCATILRAILDNLPHTPVSSMGINYVFGESDNTSQLADALIPSDTSKILQSRYVRQTTITRVLARDADNYLLNLALTNNSDEHILSFNFHYDLNSVEGYKALLSSETINAHYQDSLDISSAVYGLTLDGNEDEEE